MTKTFLSRSHVAFSRGRPHNVSPATLSHYSALFSSQDLTGSEVIWFLSLLTDGPPVHCSSAGDLPVTL